MLSFNPPKPGEPHPAALITGPRVYLRHPTTEDRSPYMVIRSASKALHEPWEATPEDARADYDAFGESGFNRMLSSADTPASQRHLICARDDHRIVGMVSLGGIQRGPLQQAFVGYWCSVHETRKGFTAEGVRLVVSRAFAGLGLHRVEINIVPENAPSLALAAAIGARREGLSPRYLRIDGAWRDHERWAVTAEEWDSERHEHRTPENPA